MKISEGKGKKNKQKKHRILITLILKVVTLMLPIGGVMTVQHIFIYIYIPTLRRRINKKRIKK